MGDVRIWAVTFREAWGAEEIVHDERHAHSGHLLFSDDNYDAALRAFQAVVADRIGKANAVYSYGHQFGVDAKAIITVQDSRSVCDEDDGCSYDGDTIELKPFNVLAG